MNTRVVRPRYQPPRRSDNILASPGTFIAALLWIVYGVMALITELTPLRIISSLVQFPAWSSIMTGVLLTAGGILVAWGTQTTTRKIDRAWAAQKAGTPLAAGGWGCYLIVLVVVDRDEFSALAAGLAHLSIALLTGVAVHRLEDQLREEMRDHGMEA